VAEADDDKQRVRLHMKDMLVERKRQLDVLEVGQTVRAKFNGEIWDGYIIQIESRQHTFPEFRLRFGTDKTGYWVSGNQIVLPGDEE
jgi:hypothetical protein